MLQIAFQRDQQAWQQPQQQPWQPLAPEAQCAVTTAAIGQNGQPLAAALQHAVTTAAIESPALDSKMASPWQFLFSECGLKFNLEIFNHALN